MDNTLPIQNVTISFQAPRALNIGDVLYRIEPEDPQSFREPCLVCNDKKELTVNGVTFKCPCCGKTKETIVIRRYLVRKYRVYKIEQSADNSDWKLSEKRKTVLGIYRKVGKGYSTYSSEFTKRSLYEYELVNNFNVSIDKISHHNLDNAIYDDYKLAVSVAEHLTSVELDKLAEYNALHGTEYNAVFSEKTHDKKSI